MAEHKNIVTRWREAKTIIMAELTRLEKLGEEIKNDIKTECGQSALIKVPGPDRGRENWNYEYSGNFSGYVIITRPLGILSQQIGPGSNLLNIHLDRPISFVEEIAKFLQGLDGRRLREAAEAGL